ncbi:MAG: transposase [Planctomycetes bacterium]|nr:transposase [Planctomycetota bacterium]
MPKAEVTGEPPISIRQGAKLPHWTRLGATYFITFRTADSIPPEAADKLRSELRALERKETQHPLDAEELARKRQLESEAYQQLLDQCHGACELRNPACAECVRAALFHFDEAQYRVWAWCIMPNHVHVVVQPLGEQELAQILKAWKSVSSRRIGAVLGRKGVFWQDESYDHIVRDLAEFDHYVKYTLENPIAAGLPEWKWVGARSDLDQWHG